MHWNIYTIHVQNFLLHVSVLCGCHAQRVFTVVLVLLTRWSVTCSTVTHVGGGSVHLLCVYFSACKVGLFS
jgi:hypothetical protein